MSSDPEVMADALQDCYFFEHLEDVTIVNTSLHQNPLPNCDTYSLRSLNLSYNSLMKFDMQHLQYLYNLKTLDMSNNNLELIKPSKKKFPELRTLKLSGNPQLIAVCTKLLRSLPNLKSLDISRTGIFSLSLGLLEHKSLSILHTDDIHLKCNCQTTLRLESMPSKDLFESLECNSPVSGTKFLLTDPKILDSLNCGDILEEEPLSEYMYRPGDSVLLDCPLEGDLQGYEILWLSPRMDLIRGLPEPAQVCPPAHDLYQLVPTTNDYSYWEDHYTVLSNGSLVIDEFGWRDRGPYTCYASNGIHNASAKAYLKLNYHYRNKIYYLSLGWGFGAAACFLGLTLLCKLMHYLLWNYGCCLCCSCCKDQQPPKIKKLAKVVDSIETYRIQQLEKLRENYNMQSQRIRDNCVMQMEKVRENYHNQVKSIKDMKNLGSAQYSGMKEQYADQLSKIREYSSGQLDKCHENYIFQRQRLRKFSAQNYLRIRETKQYTQKTMNRVLENMPALYLDLSSCKQGIGDQDLREWQDEMDRREAEMKDILNSDRVLDLEGLGDSQSLYFTPTGTPFRDISNDKGTPIRDENGRIIYSPSRSPEKGGKHRGHKRMVSNLSSLFPFWWGVSQTQQVETVAIVEPLRQDDTADTFLPDTSLNNTNNGEEQSVPLIPKDNSPEICPNSSVSQQNSPTSARALLLRRHNQAAADAARPKSQPPDSHLWNITTLPQGNGSHEEDLLLTVDARQLTDNPNNAEAASLNRSNSLPTDIGDATPPPLPKSSPPIHIFTNEQAQKNLQSRKQHHSVDMLATPLIPSVQEFGSEGHIRGRSASLQQLPADVLQVGGLDESITESSITDSGIKDCGDDDFGDMKGFGHLEIHQPVLQQGQSFEFGLKRLPEHLPQVGNSPKTALPTPTNISDQLNDQVLEVEIKMAKNVDETKMADDDENKMADNANKMVDFVSKMVDNETNMADNETKIAANETKMADNETKMAIGSSKTMDGDQNLQEDGSKHVGNGKAILADAKYLDIEMTDSVIVTDEYDVK